MQSIRPQFVTISLIRSHTGRRAEGRLYGSGEKVIIVSNMDTNNQGEWDPLIDAIVSDGYMILTYSYLQQRDDQSDTLEDVISFAEASGGKEIVLIGASRGGVASLKVAANSVGRHAIKAVAALSAPIEYEGTRFYDHDELRGIKIPKLLINSRGDDGADDTRTMYELFEEPKEMVLFPGEAHGTELFVDEQETIIAKLRDFLRLHL